MSPGAQNVRAVSLWLLGIAALLVAPAVSQSQQPVSAIQQAPEIITLDQAIQKAQANEALFAAAHAQSKVPLSIVPLQGRRCCPASRITTRSYTRSPMEKLTSTGPGAAAQAARRFIANNAVREYTSQAVVNELIGLKQFADVQSRGCLFRYGCGGVGGSASRPGRDCRRALLWGGRLRQQARRSQRAADEANSFTSLTQKREAAREAAHADVVKAQLQQQQRQRDLADATVTAEKMHLELATLLFPDPRTPYSLAGHAPIPLPSLAFCRHRSCSRSQQSGIEERPRLSESERCSGPCRSRRLSARSRIERDLRNRCCATCCQRPGWSSQPWLLRQRDPRYSRSGTGLQPGTKSSRARSGGTLHVWLSRLHNGAPLHTCRSSTAKCKVARGQIAIAGRECADGRESLRLTRLRYSSGEATVLEVVDAENSLTLAENARADGMIRYELAIANLQTLTGDL